MCEAYVDILNGEFVTSPSIGRQCNDTQDPTHVVSQSDQLRVLFHSEAGSSHARMVTGVFISKAAGI